RPRPRRILRFDHVDGLAVNRAGDLVVAVRRHVGVVNRAPAWNGFHLLQRRGVDDIDATGLLNNPDIHPPAVATDGHVVGMPAQGNPLDDLVRPDVDDVEGALGFVADVDAAAFGRVAGAVADFDSVDHGDDLVRRGIDDVDVVAGAVGL